MAEPPKSDLPKLDWPLLESVRRYARLFVPDDEAEDVSIRTWERMLLHYPHDMDSFSLARKVAKWIALDLMRAESRHHLHRHYDPEVSEAKADDRDDFASVDLWESLRSVLDSDELLVLMFAYQMEMTPAEIASILDRPRSTIYSVRTRALYKARLAFDHKAS